MNIIPSASFSLPTNNTIDPIPSAIITGLESKGNRSSFGLQPPRRSANASYPEMRNAIMAVIHAADEVYRLCK